MITANIQAHGWTAHRANAAAANAIPAASVSRPHRNVPSPIEPGPKTTQLVNRRPSTR